MLGQFDELFERRVVGHVEFEGHEIVRQPIRPRVYESLENGE